MDINEFLKHILQLESSNAFNKDHKKMTKGMHKGDAAIGGYGIMPNTVKEFIKRRALKDEFGPDEAIMKQMQGDELREFLNRDNRVEKNLAEDIGNRVLAKSEGNPEKAAYMWNTGHNTPSDSISEEDLDESPYVQKFRNLNRLITSK